MKKYLLASAAAVALCLPHAAMACSACGCNLDTEDPTAGPGWTIDGRVDFVNQNQMWQGGGKADASLRDPSTGDNHEVQRNTTTLFYTTTVDYQSAGAWGLNVAVPFQYRTHSTYNSTNGDWASSKSEWNRLSDIRVLGRYTVWEDAGLSVLGGLKLPTGSNRMTFAGGATGGQVVDRGLQPGTGTWDVLVGLAQKGTITDDLSWFAQELFQRPVAKSNDFSEGQKLNVSVGLRYVLNEWLTPQFQFNAQNRWRDHGPSNQADIPNSGGEVIYASPGVFVNFSEGTSVYGFVQIPVYQRVGGLELVPGYSASVGIKHKF